MHRPGRTRASLPLLEQPRSQGSSWAWGSALQGSSVLPGTGLCW